MTQWKPDYDKAGYCVLCHDEIAEFNGSDKQGNPIVVQLLGKADELNVRLDDGSSMKVMLCTNCRSNIKPEDMQELMESAIRGWRWEITHRLNWAQDRKDQYVKEYSKRYVVDAHNMRWSKDDLKKIKKPRKSKMEVA